MKTGRTKGGAARLKGRRKKAQGASSEFFNPKAGLLIATLLSLVLWWVPYLGPMAAGFMGGRKAGSFFRGGVVGVIAMVIVLGIATTFSVMFAAIITDFGDPVQSFSPALYEFAEQAADYFAKFVTVSGSSISFDQSNYFLMVALCLIGGAFADQSRREAKAIIDLARESNAPQPPRSVRAFREHRNLGFQTYEDYARMSVNVSAAAEAHAAERKPQKAPAEPVPEPVARVEQSQAADTVVTTTFADAAPAEDVPAEPRTVPQTRKPTDDYEFL